MALSPETLQAPNDILSLSAEKSSRKLAFLSTMQNSTSWDYEVTKHKQPRLKPKNG